ncbi:MAG TPA: hypothetical protein VMA83_08885 [Solirubrobacteraceae bacterium]|nr:hypothetical protein [Solirubrobacteraceae bacterium]
MPTPATIHLHPTATLAERVLLPGDPGRALALAQLLLERPLMFNHNRGLWGYTGAAADGEPLTIQSTGMGGPSAAIVVEELVTLGARRLIRVGTCGALDAGLSLGELVVASGAHCEDGTSRALGGGPLAAADAALTGALAAAARCRSGAVVSVDLFYDAAATAPRHGALAVEMEAATLFTLAARRGVAAAALLIVTDVFDGDGRRRRITGEELLDAAERAGRAAAAALGATR